METFLPGITVLLSFAITFYTLPRVMKKMRDKGIVGVDVNKRDKRKIPEMGGIAVVLGFSISVVVAVGIEKLSSSMDASFVLSVLGVLLIAALIGVVDDIAGLSQKVKAILVAFAAMPLVLVHPGAPTISLPFGLSLPLPFYIYWIFLVPLGITGVANALNMSAGYNGLESGEVIVMSTFLLIIAVIKKSSLSAILIFSSLLGASFALYYFNRYPARTFIGDVGTLSMGAVIGAGVIVGHIEFYGVIVILPAFFELFSTVYHNRKGVDRKSACMNPIILEDGRLKAPEGTKWYTLPYFLLTKKPMGEKELVNRMLSIYALCGMLALLLSFL